MAKDGGRFSKIVEIVEDDNKMVLTPEDVALRLISICNSDKQYKKRSNEYQDYFNSWKYYP